MFFTTILNATVCCWFMLIIVLSAGGIDDSNQPDMNALRRLQFENLSQEDADRFKQAGFERLFMPSKPLGNEEFLYRRRGGGNGKSATKRKKITSDASTNLSYPDVKSSSKLHKLKKIADRILVESDKYNMWWTGPGDEFAIASWSTPHNSSKNAIFTVAMQQGKMNIPHLTSPRDLILFLGSARKVFAGDIVMAFTSDTITDIIKRILMHYKATVYVLPKHLCSKDKKYIYCGPNEERVPLSVFRYFFYEKWAAIYAPEALILLTDYQDIYFQDDPFGYHRQEWIDTYQLLLFQEFFPKMIIQRSEYHSQIIAECYGSTVLQEFGNRNILSTGGQLGTRDGIVLWSHGMTKQVIDASGRKISDSRCISDSIDHAFVNYLYYSGKFRNIMKIKSFPQGDGMMNSLGGILATTSNTNNEANSADAASTPGSLKGLWKILDQSGYILNWNGELSPIVHQLHQFTPELLSIFDELNQQGIETPYINSPIIQNIRKHVQIQNVEKEGRKSDLIWQILTPTQCLFDCDTSLSF